MSPASRNEKIEQIDLTERQALWHYQIIEDVYEKDLADLARTQITRHIGQANEDGEVELTLTSGNQTIVRWMEKAKDLRVRAPTYDWIKLFRNCFDPGMISPATHGQRVALGNMTLSAWLLGVCVEPEEVRLDSSISGNVPTWVLAVVLLDWEAARGRIRDLDCQTEAAAQPVKAMVAV